MFGRTSILRRYLLAVGDSNHLQALFRYLLRVVQVVPFYGLISLVLLYSLYRIAENKFAEWYFGPGDISKPGFPSSWRILFLSLFVVPTFSILQIVWLSLKHLLPPCLSHWWGRRYSSPSRPSQGYSMLPWGEPDSLEERGPSGISDDEGCGLRNIEGDVGSSRPRSPFQHQALRHLFSFFLSPWFLFWFAILCTSLWLGLHYQYQGDLRYLPLIEEANAHPKRAGYANQGQYNSQSFVRDPSH